MNFLGWNFLKYSFSSKRKRKTAYRIFSLFSRKGNKTRGGDDQNEGRNRTKVERKREKQKSEGDARSEKQQRRKRINAAEPGGRGRRRRPRSGWKGTEGGRRPSRNLYKLGPDLRAFFSLFLLHARSLARSLVREALGTNPLEWSLCEHEQARTQTLHTSEYIVHILYYRMQRLFFIDLEIFPPISRAFVVRRVGSYTDEHSHTCIRWNHWTLNVTFILKMLW